MYDNPFRVTLTAFHWWKSKTKDGTNIAISLKKIVDMALAVHR
jgi:hypothetical protein